MTTRNSVLIGDALTLARGLPDESVNCIVTSPPYWGLRSYLPDDHPDKASEMGAEPTLAEYVDRMVALFRELRRALRKDGTCWLNLGDCYAGSWGNQGRKETRGTQRPINGGMLTQVGDGRHGDPQASGTGTIRDPGLKPKDLCLVPYRVALALQADGWYLRSHIVWAKGVSFCEHYSGSVMPESVRDRPTNAHEAVFLLTKSERYYYDADAVRERFIDARNGNPGKTNPVGSAVNESGRRDGNYGAGGDWNADGTATGRNLRNVWAISPRPYSGSHYAVFPPQLVAPMVKAGCPAKVCAECGAPWERVVERTATNGHRERDVGGRGDGFTRMPGGAKEWAERVQSKTTGWRPTCAHDGATAPGLVLDPFLGSGTVAAVAESLGRDWLGFDIDERNAGLVAERTMARTTEEALAKNEPGALPGQASLFG